MSRATGDVRDPYTYQAALMTLPTKDRVGVFPIIVLLLVGGVIFYLTFQYWLFDLNFAVNKNLYLEPSVVDTLVALGFPSCLLFGFVFSQVRIRLNLYWLNAWSIINSILMFIALLSMAIYCFAHPEGVFGFMQTLFVDQEQTMGSLVKFMNSWGKSIQKTFSNPESNNFIGLMYFAGYAFPLHFLYVLIFITAASDRFGERQLYVAMRAKTYGQPDVLILSGKELKKVK